MWERSSRWWPCRCSRPHGSRDAPWCGRSSTRWRTCRPNLGEDMKAAFIILAVALATTTPHADDAVAPLLKDADRYRTGQDDLQVETQVTVLNRDGSQDKERRYTVYVQAQHKSLV